MVSDSIPHIDCFWCSDLTIVTESGGTHYSMPEDYTSCEACRRLMACGTAVIEVVPSEHSEFPPFKDMELSPTGRWMIASPAMLKRMSNMLIVDKHHSADPPGILLLKRRDYCSFESQCWLTPLPTGESVNQFLH